jgi:hypothetical protein
MKKTLGYQLNQWEFEKKVKCQYSETNVKHFLFNSLWIKGLYTTDTSSTPTMVQPTDNTHEMYQVLFVTRLQRMSR